MIEVFGLTGKTGAGKSTVAKLLEENRFYVIDGDVIARSVTQKGSAVLKKLEKRFSNEIIFPDGTLNRKKLAEIAFSSAENTNALNEITHGAIDEIFRKEIENAEKSGFKKCVIDAAALLESPSKKLCEKMIVVTAPEEIRLERILKRDNITESDAKRRMSAQKDDEYYLSAADIIIRNYPPYDLKEEMQKVI